MTTASRPPRRTPALPIALALLLFAGSTLAEAPGFKRTILQRADAGPGLEVVLGLAEGGAGSSTGRHTHFGVETGYVIAGTSVLEIDGEAPRVLKPGDTYLIPAGKVHNAIVREGAAMVLATYVIEKGKPLATPAP